MALSKSARDALADILDYKQQLLQECISALNQLSERVTYETKNRLELEAEIAEIEQDLAAK